MTLFWSPGLWGSIVVGASGQRVLTFGRSDGGFNAGRTALPQSNWFPVWVRTELLSSCIMGELAY